MLNKPVLLSLLVVLLIARFVLLPMVQSQNDKRSELDMVTAQLTRALQAIDEQPALQTRLEQQQASNTNWQTELPSAASMSELRLVMQQGIQASLRSHDVEVSLFNWLSEVEHDSPNLSILRARVTVSTDEVPLHDAMLSMLSQMPNIRIEEVELQRQIQRRRGGTQYQAILLFTAVGKVER